MLSRRNRLAIAILVLHCLFTSPSNASSNPTIEQRQWTRSQQTPLVTGNGFGFAVLSPKSDCITGLYAHPYKFAKPDPKDELSEGIETTNFVKSMTWTDSESGTSEFNYLDQSQILSAQSSRDTRTYFMPFGIDQNVLIATWEPDKHSTAPLPSLTVSWAHLVKAALDQRVYGTDIKVLTFDGVDEALAIIPLGKAQDQKKDFAHVTSENHEMICSGFTGWAFISIDGSNDLPSAIERFQTWRKDLSPSALVERETIEIEKWRAPPTVHFQSEAERKLWRQSEMTLRMAQVRESNRSDRHNHGLIIASLPDGAWFVPWMRDMAYATIALIRMGHRQEALSAVRAYFDAQPVGKLEKEVGYPYQISLVRYFGDGSEEPFFTMEGSNNVELDDWGLALWVLGEYVKRFESPQQQRTDSILSIETYRGSIYDSAKKYIVEPLLGNLEPYMNGLIVTKDTSIWEEKQKDKKHFAFSSAAAIKGLKCFDDIATEHGDGELHSMLQKKLSLLQKGFNQAFVPNGILRGALEEGLKNEVDGAMLAAINFGIVTDDAVIRKAVSQMDRLKMPSGGYRRVTSNYEDPAIYEYWYERQEFLFIDFAMAEVFLRLKQPEKATSLLQTIVDKASLDHNFIPEMYVSQKNYRFKGDIGDPTGAIPMVGYGAGAFIAYLLERETLGSGK